MDEKTGGFSEIGWNVIKVVGSGVMVASSLIAPNAVSALAPLFQSRANLTNSQAQAGLRYAMKKGWVAYREKGDQFELYLTKLGKARWQKIELDKTLTGRHWDGKWRVVIFDISSKRRLRRDALRNHLKRVGFRQLQESVWVNPYECANLIAALRLIYGLTRNEVRLVESSSFDGEQAFAEIFGLK